MSGCVRGGYFSPKGANFSPHGRVVGGWLGAWCAGRLVPHGVKFSLQWCQFFPPWTQFLPPRCQVAGRLVGARLGMWLAEPELRCAVMLCCDAVLCCAVLLWCTALLCCAVLSLCCAALSLCCALLFCAVLILFKTKRSKNTEEEFKIDLQEHGTQFLHNSRCYQISHKAPGALLVLPIPKTIAATNNIHTGTRRNMLWRLIQAKIEEDN